MGSLRLDCLILGKTTVITNLMESEFFNFPYLKILPLRFWLGRSASLPASGFGFRHINRGASVRDGKAEGFADVYLGTNKRGDELCLATVFNAPYGAHFCQHGLC